MKMIKKCVLPVLFIAGLNPAPVLAQDNYYLSYQCESAARRLESLAYSGTHYNCVGEIQIAASHIKVAAKQIERAKYQHAQMSLSLAKSELDNVRMAGERCSYFSPKVPSYIAELIQLDGELDVMERMTLQHNLNKTTNN
ncbi:hypothetical protein [Legionella fairfieldensis]|uniref:hypothetical protein n=1 Tax=Legionella fairfieldensis TaxID=45064 RepID=UPI0004918156|nr:hypothetical protein [Legionella fairfieldensis]